MILRSQVQGGRISAAIPGVEIRPDVEFQLETEIENPAEVVPTIPTDCERALSTAARPTMASDEPVQSVGRGR